MSGITKAINDSNAAKEQLGEAMRHNQMMESISLGKGLYLRPYKAGSGVKLRLHTENLKKKSVKLPDRPLTNLGSSISIASET